MKDDFELMARIGRGDKEAFEQLYNKFRSPLANFLYKMSWDPALVEELLQDVFLSVWRAASRFEARSKVSTYLYTLARNAFINEARKRSHRRVAEAGVRTPEEAVVESGDPDRPEQRVRVRALIESLPEEEREALILAYYNGLPYQQIAEIQGVPVGTIKSRVHRALGRLRQTLKR